MTIELVLDLDKREADELRGWLVDQLGDMEVDEESIEEERPGLLGAIRELAEKLEQQP